MYRIVHISDVHIPPLPRLSPRDLASKRLLGLLSWHRKWKGEHLAEIIQALQRKIGEIHPDHLCVTGDLTFTGHPVEIERSVRWLSSLGPVENISLIPGNHDAYVPGALEQACRRWAPWMIDDETGEQAFPYLHRRGPVDLIGLSSGVPLRLPHTTGRLGVEQLEKALGLLQRIKGDGRPRILLIHHPPQEGAARPGKALQDREALREILAQHPVDLVLHGHMHKPLQATLQADEKPIPVLGAGSASTLGQRYSPAHFHLLEFDAGYGQHAIGVRHGTYNSASGMFELGPAQALPSSS